MTTRFSTIDLAALPPPDVVQALDAEAIIAARKADIVARLRAEVGDALADEVQAILALESEPMTKIQQTGAYRETIHYARVNEAARAVMLAFSRGSDLEQLGALYGVARMSGEDDERLRLRIRLAPDAWEGAGPAAGIVYHAMSADLRVKRVGLQRVKYKADITVVILSTDGDGTATDDLLHSVRQRLLAEDVALMTDATRVRSAAILPYEIAVHLKLPPGVSAANVETACRAALQQLAAGRHDVGRKVPVTAIDAAAHLSSVDEIVRTSPASDVLPDEITAPYATSIAVTSEPIDG